MKDSKSSNKTPSKKKVAKKAKKTETRKRRSTKKTKDQLEEVEQLKYHLAYLEMEKSTATALAFKMIYEKEKELPVHQPYLVKEINFKKSLEEKEKYEDLFKEAHIAACKSLGLKGKDLENYTIDPETGEVKYSPLRDGKKEGK